MYQFDRLGDRNERARERLAHACRFWLGTRPQAARKGAFGKFCASLCQAAEDRNARQQWVVVTTGSRFHAVADFGDAEDLLKDLRSTSEETMHLAEEAARRQATKTEADMTAWTEQVVRDVQDADD